MSAGHGSWYGWMFLSLAFAVVFPDEFLQNLRLSLTWRRLLWLEATLAGVIAGAMILLKFYHIDLPWFFPLFFIGLVSVFRGIIWYLGRSD